LLPSVSSRDKLDEEGGAAKSVRNDFGTSDFEDNAYVGDGGNNYQTFHFKIYCNN